MSYVSRKDEAEAVLRISRGRLTEILDISDPTVRRTAIGLLQEHDLIRPHRLSRARGGEPVDGWTLPPGWGSEHVPHLGKRAQALLADHGVRPDESSLMRILRW